MLFVIISFNLCLSCVHVFRFSCPMIMYDVDTDTVKPPRYASRIVLTPEETTNVVKYIEQNKRNLVDDMVTRRYSPQTGDVIYYTYKFRSKSHVLSGIFDGKRVLGIKDGLRQIEVLNVSNGFISTDFWRLVIEDEGWNHLTDYMKLVRFNSNQLVHSTESIVAQFPQDVLPIPPIRNIIGSYATTTFQEILLQNFKFTGIDPYTTNRLRSEMTVSIDRGASEKPVKLTVMSSFIYHSDEDYIRTVRKGLENGLFHPFGRDTLYLNSSCL